MLTGLYAGCGKVERLRAFMSPDDAKSFGLIDEVVVNRPPRPDEIKAAE